MLPTQAEAIVEGLVKLKKVRKAILKLENSEKELKTSTIAEKTLNNLINPLNSSNIENIHLNIASVALRTPEKVEMTTKMSKKRSTKGDNSSIVEQNAPITAIIGHILENTAPKSGVQETIAQTTPVVNSSMIICDDISKKEDVLGDGGEKRGRGRPAGSLDKVARHKKGELLKPPVQHGKLGRPLGSKDKAPRRKVLQNSVDST